MNRCLILLLIFLFSCSKQDNSKTETKTENLIETETENLIDSNILNRVKVDSLLVSNNIFQISYNEKYEQPNWVKYTVRDIVKNGGDASKYLPER